MRSLISVVFVSFFINSTKLPKTKHKNDQYYLCKSMKMIKPHLFSSQAHYHNPVKNLENKKKEHQKDLTADLRTIHKTVNPLTKSQFERLSMENNVDRLNLYNDQDLFGVSLPNKANLYGFGLNSDELDDVLINGLNHLNDGSISAKGRDNKIIDIENTDLKSANRHVPIDTFSSTSEESLGLSIEKIIETIDTDSSEDINEDYEKQEPINSRIKDKTNELEINSVMTVSFDYIMTLKYDVEQFITFHIPKQYQNVYFERIMNIHNFIKLADKLKIYKQESCYASIDRELEEVLRSTYETFDKNSTFDKQTSMLFSIDLICKTSKISEQYTLNRQLLSYEERALSFCFEYMKLYKYTAYIPEILTIGGIFSDKLCRDPTFFLHLLNLFIEKICNKEDNSVFIRCMIHRAFTYSLKHRVNLFLIQRIFIKCNREHKNLYFFAWEIDSRIRQSIKRKTKEGHFYNTNYTDEIHMKTILLIFLYQHVIFLKCHCVSIEDIHTFSSFFVRLKISNECFVCIFDDFMKLLKNQIDKIKKINGGVK